MNTLENQRTQPTDVIDEDTILTYAIHMVGLESDAFGFETDPQKSPLRLTLIPIHIQWLILSDYNAEGITEWYSIWLNHYYKEEKVHPETNNAHTKFVQNLKNILEETNKKDLQDQLNSHLQELNESPNYDAQIPTI